LSAAAAEERLAAAVACADDGLHGRAPVRGGGAASACARRAYFAPAYVALYAFAALVLCVLAQWEPPARWGAASQRRSAALAAGDGALLAFFALDWGLLQRAYYGAAGWRARGWTWVLGAALVALATNLAITAGSGWRLAYPARILRPLFLVHRLATVRKIAANVGKSLPQVIFAEMLLGERACARAQFYATTCGCHRLRYRHDLISSPQACTSFSPPLLATFCLRAWAAARARRQRTRRARCLRAFRRLRPSRARLLPTLLQRAPRPAAPPTLRRWKSR